MPTKGMTPEGRRTYWEEKFRDAMRKSVSDYNKVLIQALEDGYEPFETIGNLSIARMIVNYRKLLREIHEITQCENIVSDRTLRVRSKNIRLMIERFLDEDALTVINKAIAEKEDNRKKALNKNPR